MVGDTATAVLVSRSASRGQTAVAAPFDAQGDAPRAPPAILRHGPDDLAQRVHRDGGLSLV
jgi:hypothetical protein